MKKIAMFVVMMVVFVVAISTAEAQTSTQSVHRLSLGFHGAYSLGGDIERSNLGIGGQVIVPLGDTFSMEVSATRFEDGIDDLLIDMMTIGVTLRAAMPVMENRGKVYVGAGFSHNSFDANIAWPGYNVSIEDSIGWHVAVGFSTRVHQRAELFGEYRYTMTRSTAEVSSPCGCHEIVTGSYNFGLLRLGVNFMF